ncbi:expressed unknown protein [Seminavis robusta]|uniref:Transmembrane protein n=1 Tax=Seminavis robusta TaxID=568900 RepID=A0A9N8H6C2_9STRA|nr:expressed unknown protein [Seminavis robusta]|eukprot:Sro142_g066080.1 n/a (378) ;mRNA; f:18197-19330
MTSNSGTTSTGKSVMSPGTSGNDRRNCSVDAILSNIFRSFQSTSGLLPGCSKKDCSINWNAMFIPTAAAAPNQTTTTDKSSFSWLSSLDYVKSISIDMALPPQSSTTTSNTSSATTTGPSYSQGMYERFGNFSEVLAETRIASSITQQLEESLTSFMTDTLRVTTTGVFVGAVVGAAVATGVMVGMMAAMGAMASSEYVPWIYRKLSSLLLTARPPSNSHDSPSPKPPKEAKEKKPASDESSSASSDSSAVLIASSSTSTAVANGPLVILQGHPACADTTTTSAKDQCLSCLEQLAANLRNQSLAWQDICRLTVYLVSGKCDASTFRAALQHHLSSLLSNTSNQEPLVTILFVQQLESENAVIQVEAMASKGNKIII